MCGKKELIMAANAIPNSNVTIDSQRAVDHEEKKLSEIALPLKERVTKVLHQVFEGHEEFLGATPD
jgi:hypothetical protein